MKQRPERKYSLGLRSMCGACSGVSSQCSSRRSSQNGSQPTLASRKRDAQLGEAVQDAADGERHHREHLPDGVREGVDLEARLEAIDADRHLVDRLAAAVDADGDVEALGLAPDDVEARVVEVLVAHVLRRDHADHAELGDRAAQLGGRRVGIDHRQLGDRHEPLRARSG